jgi:hypothetical protein
MKNLCPHCRKKLVNWDELTEVEKTVFQSKPTNCELSQRKKHRFCPRCLFEDAGKNLKT